MSMIWEIVCGDAVEVLRGLESGSVNCVVTSPPYWGLRDYRIELRAWGGRADHNHTRWNPEWGKDGQTRFCECGAWLGSLGLEPTPSLFVEHVVSVFREVRRVLRDDGVLWLNLGDSYANDGKWGGETGGKQAYLDDNNRKRVGREKRFTGLKPKSLVGIPWRVAFGLQADGWCLRSDVIWAKPNPMPESVQDRPTRSHEYVFLMTKSGRYWYDGDAIAEPSVCDRMRGPALHGDLVSTNGNSGLARREVKSLRNRRDVWWIATEGFPGAHFATFPRKLVEPCVLAGCPEGGLVLDPFCGSGTVGVVSIGLGRRFVGIELSGEYVKMAEERLRLEELKGRQLELAP